MVSASDMQFATMPSPLAVRFRKEDQKFTFVAERSDRPLQTAEFVNGEMDLARPQILALENLNYEDLRDAAEWRKRFYIPVGNPIGQRESAAAMAAQTAARRGIRLMGLDPAPSQQSRSAYLRDKGYTEHDVLQFMLYKRLVEIQPTVSQFELTPFLDRELSRMDPRILETITTVQFRKWTRTMLGRDFSVAQINAADLAPNCAAGLLTMGRLACEFEHSRFAFQQEILQRELSLGQSIVVLGSSRGAADILPKLQNNFADAPELVQSKQ